MTQDKLLDAIFSQKLESSSHSLAEVLTGKVVLAMCDAGELPETEPVNDEWVDVAFTDKRGWHWNIRLELSETNGDDAEIEGVGILTTARVQAGVPFMIALVDNLGRAFEIINLSLEIPASHGEIVKQDTARVFIDMSLSRPDAQCLEIYAPSSKIVTRHLDGALATYRPSD